MQARLKEQTWTDSDEVFELISHWIEVCEGGHKCAHFEVFDPDWIPSRLIDVSGDKVCLIERSSLPSRPPYIALSHCWGLEQIITTTMLEIDAFKVAIPQDRCPATFIDAFNITRGLNYAYIWIDSLCILQDSKEDWQKESAMMSKVYGNCVVDLVAAHAKDGRDGCFSKRSPSLVRPCRIPNPFNTSSNNDFIIYPKNIHDIHNEQVRDSPIYQRGWILQERLLSPRTVYFGKEQIFWVCEELQACETYPNGWHCARERQLDEIALDKRELHRLAHPLLEWTQAEVPIAAKAWARIVKMYSSSRLTKPSDKLVALAGIADRMRHIIGGDYLAGHWNGEYLTGQWSDESEPFMWSLLWHIDPKDKGFARPSEYRAPSWAWASVDGTVEMTVPDWKSRRTRDGLVTWEVDWQVTLKAATTTKAMHSPYGAVLQGNIVLLGTIRTAHLRKLDGEGEFDHLFDGQLYKPGSGADESPSCDFLCDCHLDVPAEVGDDCEVICLTFVEERKHNGDRNRMLSMCYGLLLQQAPNNPKHHVRIGRFASRIKEERSWLLTSDGEEMLLTIV